MKKILLLLLTFECTNSFSQTTDWALDIAPILYKNCTQCHHSGGLAPFPLMTYNDAFIVKTGIQDAVNNRRMPPWPPDPAYVPLAHERLLDTNEVNSINDWVNNGAISGNLSLAPAPPIYNNNSLLGIPDLSLTIPTYSVGSVGDIYRCFVLPSGLLAQKFISAMEIIPGNPSIVHHVLVYSDDTNACLTLDSLDPGPGYTNFSGTGSNSSKLIGAWVPGTLPYSLPTGLGISLNAGTNIIVQIHYPAGSLGMIDSTKLNFLLLPGPMREVTILPVLNHTTSLVNGPFFIPANTIKTFHEKVAVTNDVSILALAPHMHYIGKSITAYAVTPVNDTLPMIKINNWDFHWQGSYSFKKILKVPGGSELHAFATYDNTSANPLNPNNPPKYVTLGEATTDEMMLVYFFFLAYQPGDENINLDTTYYITGVNNPDLGNFIVTPQLYDIYPNPGQENIQIQFYMPDKREVSFQLIDINGKVIGVVKEKHIFQAGLNEFSYDISTLAKGNYLISFISEKYTKSKHFIKQ